MTGTAPVSPLYELSNLSNIGGHEATLTLGISSIERTQDGYALIIMITRQKKVFVMSLVAAVATRRYLRKAPAEVGATGREMEKIPSASDRS